MQQVIKKLEFNKIRIRLVGFCGSAQAKEEAENLLPFTERNIILAALQETNEARELLRLYPTFTLGGLRDIRTSLSRVDRGGVIDPLDFLNILDTIQGAAKVKSFFSNIKGEFSSLRDIARNIHLFKTLERKITDCITNEGLVADNASSALAKLRSAIKNNQEKVKAKLDNIMRDANIQKYLQDNIITVRDGRYVVPVKLECRANVPGLVHDQSASGATVFIEPMALVEINNTLRRLGLEEEQEVAKILKELSAIVAEQGTELSETVDAMVKLDLILAKGILSEKMKAVCPQVSIDGSLLIKKGRHPLITGNVVPIDVNLGKSFDTLVITGPNTGGKTVTLKTVGLLTLMFMAGLHVPADDGTILYPFNQIFSDIGDEQSIEQSLSTFSSHMKNIVKIIKDSNSETLVLLDELGAGTDPTEGAALGMAILDVFHEKHTKVIATTHYSELKAYAYTHQRIENASVEFDVENLTPTYKLSIGIPGSSNAFEIARRLGLPANIIDKAKAFLSQEDVKVADLIKNLEDNEQKAQEERLAIFKELNEARIKHQQAEERMKNSEFEAAEKIRLAYVEAQKIISQTKEDSEKIYRELHTTMHDETKIIQNFAINESRRKLQEHEQKLSDKLSSEIKNKPFIKVAKGDNVFLTKLKINAVVLQAPDPKGDVLVQAGIMKITVSLRNIEHTSIKEAIISNNVGILSKEKRTEMGNVVDVRGKIIDEALDELEKFLDDAFLAGIETINIIHGKGTGALRKAIGLFLKNDIRVISHRLADFNAGGTGVTVVTLKN